MILVVGATGPLGSLVVRQLRAGGAAVRAMVPLTTVESVLREKAGLPELS